jgi:hypothetical protein
MNYARLGTVAAVSDSRRFVDRGAEGRVKDPMPVNDGFSCPWTAGLQALKIRDLMRARHK